MRKRKTKKPKILPIIFLSLLLLGVSAVAYAYFWWTNSQKPLDLANTEIQKIIIPKGHGTISIGDLLEEKEIIRSSLAFRLLVDRKAYSSKLQAGSYDLSPSQPLDDIIESLTTGLQDFWVTIPEGKRHEEIAKILNDEFTNQGLTFSIPDFLETSQDLEGYLFPDTYLLPLTMDAIGVVDLMRNTFDIRVPDSLKAQASNFNLEFQEVLILASLIEREAKFEKDRPLIAGVLLNRLDINMALQIDATVQYAVGANTCALKVGRDCKWWPVISSTKLDSPYNTYQHPGLPPAPICNPGLSAIEAVLSPASHNYLYYLSENNGKTYYSETLQEHNLKIKQYLD